MVAPIYGTLAVARATGGIADTLHPLDVAASSGNGFSFEHYDSNGLRWAIDQALEFFALPREIREREIGRIMRESKPRFSHARVASQYVAAYEEMLARPLVSQRAYPPNGWRPKPFVPEPSDVAAVPSISSLPAAGLACA
jgi:glycogen synthase